jgi:hypothetical protein
MASSLEQRLARLEAEVTQLKAQQNASKLEKPWWKKIIGMYANDPHFEAAVTSGRAHRKASGAMGDAATELSELPENDLHSLQEALETLKEPIALALERNYTFAEIAQMLTARGIVVDEVELSAYFGAKNTVL